MLNWLYLNYPTGIRSGSLEKTDPRFHHKPEDTKWRWISIRSPIAVLTISRKLLNSVGTWNRDDCWCFCQTQMTIVGLIVINGLCRSVSTGESTSFISLKPRFWLLNTARDDLNPPIWTLVLCIQLSEQTYKTPKINYVVFQLQHGQRCQLIRHSLQVDG